MTAYELARREGRRVFYEPATDTIRQCPENYLLAVRDASGRTRRFAPAPDAASPINGHSLGIVLDLYQVDDPGGMPRCLAEKIELAFWGKVGGHDVAS